MTVEITPILLQDGFGEAPSTPHWEPHKYKPIRRDGQRRKEYRAEWAFNKVHPEEGMGKLQLRAYLNMVVRDQWFIDRFGKVFFTVEISRRRSVTASCCRRGVTFTLKFPELGGHCTRLLALHELGHVLVYEQSHGPIYCAVLLQITTHFMGLIAGAELRRQFILNSVDFVR